ncbi:DUF2799 domain-containing protein [Vibrio proteolyticus]|uniref:Lipoprotein n=1 Tax=Vibrio proteolyticus NBRC 13287 TaxID=1219065 RepID=U3BM17_VIBPR|nr:DUF2799 domain-containing protein [Vibrio proteolyticus]GAD67653.1 hypothetical protein VPR01S_09_00270 [Vibrio proteolyticus NBRC 13287]
MKTIIILSAVAILAGCASSTADLAQQGNWHQIGYQDGVKGAEQRNYKELSKYGAANQADYNLGYSEGLEEYCNPNFAYQIGLSGQYYSGVCEGTKSAQKFRMEWQRGWNDYSTNNSDY